MKYLIFCALSVIVTSVHAYLKLPQAGRRLMAVPPPRSVYRHQLGHCEPLTVEFIASLVSKEARQLIVPEVQQRELRFDLYTRRNPDERHVLRVNDQAALQSSNFNANWPVRFTIHGWNGHTSTCSNAAIKDAYLTKGDYNVILVDWSDYSLDINYIRVVAEMSEIAEKFNAFARFLYRRAGIPYAEMYLIAHSAGCHIAGLAGKLLKPERYGVIYALDTSGPVHRALKQNFRLAPSDALYVESIQTDVTLFGYPNATLGQASFFPNWGLGQPHCPNSINMEPNFTCDHFGALYYFVESLRDGKAFGAVKCDNYEGVRERSCGCGCGQRQCEVETYMGGDPATPKRGIYYLSTRKTQPFGYGSVCRMKRAIDPTILRLKSNELS